jgi:hypothetical protein
MLKDLGRSKVRLTVYIRAARVPISVIEFALIIIARAFTVI